VSFRDLDGKAQGTATVAGAFLAAGLALLNRSGGIDSLVAKPILGGAVAGLATSIVFSVLALRLRQVLSCPSGQDVGKLLDNLATVPPENLAERIVYFYGDVAQLWRGCTLDRRAANERKARYIAFAQTSLVSSALCIAVLILWLLTK